jgi:hypothetical protein
MKGVTFAERVDDDRRDIPLGSFDLFGALQCFPGANFILRARCRPVETKKRLSSFEVQLEGLVPVLSLFSAGRLG